MPSEDCSNPLDDIEDIVGALDLTPNERASGRDRLVPRARRRRKVERKEEEPVEPPIFDSVVPGLK